MTHREIAARTALKLQLPVKSAERDEHAIHAGIDFADAFERIYAERTTEQPSSVDKDSLTPANDEAVELVRYLRECYEEIYRGECLALDLVDNLIYRCEVFLAKQERK